MNESDIQVVDRAVRHVFLSPHYDDVALSCGGTVAQLTANGESTVVVTVMGGIPSGPLTEFARGQHERWGFRPEDAVEMRRREDRCAEAELGVTSVWLDTLDAIYRADRYTSDEEIFGAIHPEEEDLPSQIVAAIENHSKLGLSETDRFYVPLAIGNHVDHQLTLEAGRLLASKGFGVWGYEDFPYAGDPAWRGAIQQQITMLGCGSPQLVWLTEGDLERKVAAVKCYASQIDVIFRFQGDPEAAIRKYASAVGEGRAAERYWRLEPMQV